MSLDLSDLSLHPGDMTGSVTEILRRRADATPQATTYTFLHGDESERLTCAALHRGAARLAAMLRAITRPGDRAILVFRPGLDFVEALFGCFYAGLIVVPAPLPRGRRLVDGLAEGLAAICRDCEPSVLLVDPDTEAAILRDTGSAEFHGARLVTLPDDADDATWDDRDIQAHDIALLQYTSGSTGRPKGVTITHANLLDNLERQRRLYGAGPGSHGVIWLPPYHDMGLGSGILQPLFSGSTVTLMSPLEVMQRPIRWLRAIAENSATISGGPPFAFAACVATIGEEERRTLDLSSWRSAFVGAEPVRLEVLDRFAEAFAPCGFRRDAFQPSYGLAEATLLVSGVRRGSALAARARTLPGPARASCGEVIEDHELLVVDPLTSQPREEGEEGEIWLRGPGVAAGYWRDPELTATVFGARLADGRGPYLRSGDLGVLQGGALAITGRMKNVIIVAGRNLHGEDIEATVLGLPEAGAAPGAIAAFGVEMAGEERLVVALEARRAPGEALGQRARSEVARRHSVVLHDLWLVPPGRLPRTSSGKIRRHLCRELYLQAQDGPHAGAGP